MGDLCRRLKDVSEAGIYRLNCPAEDLRASATEGGFIVFEADIANASGKGEVLAELARAIAAPDWFGHNWDALADALGDLSWCPASGYVLLLHGDPSGEAVLGDILDATISFWKLNGKAFWVFIA
ncbi:barstar (barnase inhibitor) [mine drainage metagenome]|uniref:Barstar (Barnase inhibitor) n=1 Tax=mine drainage metagenome TaxID=410659 RepID=A0A1J5SXC6_9ZZZZ